MLLTMLVVGAGAAGIGVGITLQHVGIENFIIVDRDTVGASLPLGQLKLDSSLPHSQVIQSVCLISTR